MQMSKADVLDKYSILAMKVRHDAALIPMFKEYEAEAARIIHKATGKSGEVLTAVAKLIEANAKIWQLEAKIRDEFKDDPENNGDAMTFEAVGAAALLIRRHNALRIAAKNEIDKFFGQVPEPKIDHASSQTPVIAADDTTKQVIREMLEEARN